MSEPYAGQAAERAAKAKARYIANGGYSSKRAAQLAGARGAIRNAIFYLESDHVQQDIACATKLLKNAQ